MRFNSTPHKEIPMFGISKKLFGAKRAVKKLENRDLMQAIVGGCLLVAAADGEVSALTVVRGAKAHFGGVGGVGGGEPTR